MIPQEADQTHIEYGFPVGAGNLIDRARLLEGELALTQS